jgi:hypothetical protein
MFPENELWFYLLVIERQLETGDAIAVVVRPGKRSNLMQVKNLETLFIADDARSGCECQHTFKAKPKFPCLEQVGFTRALFKERYPFDVLLLEFDACVVFNY